MVRFHPSPSQEGFSIGCRGRLCGRSAFETHTETVIPGKLDPP